MTFSSYFWLLVWWFLFFAYLMVLFHIIGDLFRDKELSGWWKAVWIVALILVPFFGALIYLIARGGGMRSATSVRAFTPAAPLGSQTWPHVLARAPARGCGARRDGPWSPPRRRRPQAGPPA